MLKFTHKLGLDLSEQGSDDLFIKTKQEAFINPMDHTNQLQFEIQVTEKDYRTLSLLHHRKTLWISFVVYFLVVLVLVLLFNDFEVDALLLTMG